MKLVFATGNSGKLREAKEILGEGFELVTPAEMGLTEEIEETGNTLRANSLIKAQFITDRLNCNGFADDSGLEVEVLNGRPGVHSARYAGGDGHDFRANMDKLSDEMARKETEASFARAFGLDTVHATRKAWFRTVVTLVLDDKKYFFEGRLDGRIGLEQLGDGGFGYDPLFIPDMIPGEGENGLVPNTNRLTLAQLTEEQKNAISHRGKAMRAMAEFLRNER